MGDAQPHEPQDTIPERIGTRYRVLGLLGTGVVGAIVHAALQKQAPRKAVRCLGWNGRVIGGLAIHVLLPVVGSARGAMHHGIGISSDLPSTIYDIGMHWFQSTICHLPR